MNKDIFTFFLSLLLHGLTRTTRLRNIRQYIYAQQLSLPSFRNAFETCRFINSLGNYAVAKFAPIYIYIQDTSVKVHTNTNATRWVRIIRPFVISHERRSPRSWWMLRWPGTNNLLMKRVYAADVELCSLSRSVFHDATTANTEYKFQPMFSYYGYWNPLWNGKRKQFYMFVMMHSRISNCHLRNNIRGKHIILSFISSIFRYISSEAFHPMLQIFL